MQIIQDSITFNYQDRRIALDKLSRTFQKVGRENFVPVASVARLIFQFLDSFDFHFFQANLKRNKVFKSSVLWNLVCSTFGSEDDFCQLLIKTVQVVSQPRVS